jgi:hypothetical protein
MQLIIADKNNLQDKHMRTQSKVSYWFLVENGFIVTEEPIAKVALNVTSGVNYSCNLSSLVTTSSPIINSGSLGISPSVSTITDSNNRVRALENEVAELREQIERILNER